LVNQTSGAAGLLHWIQEHYDSPVVDELDKRDKRLEPVLDWIAEEYEGGRVTAIGDAELETSIRDRSPELYALITGRVPVM
jgi:hypothetical protein